MRTLDDRNLGVQSTSLKFAGLAEPLNPDPINDEFNIDSSADYTLVSPSGTPVLSITDGYARVSLTDISVPNDLTAWMKADTISIGDHYSVAYSSFGAGTFGPQCGVILSDGATTTSNFVAPLRIDERVGIEEGTFTQMNNSYPRIVAVWGGRDLFFSRITYVAANTWRGEWSMDGLEWSTFAFADLSDTMTPTHVGFGISGWGMVGKGFGRFAFLRKNWTP